MHVVFAAALLALASAAPTPSPSPEASPAPAIGAWPGLAPLLVKGQVLSIASGYFIFTSGDAVRMSPDLAVPKGVTTGSYVRITIDPLTHAVTAIEREPKIALAGEIEAASIPRDYVVVSARSAPLPAPSVQAGGPASGPVTVTILVHVPGNTPPSDQVYLSTDRSSYSPSEISMQRIDGTTFSVSVSLAGNTTLKYQFTRGTYATVERDRTGGIIPPRVLNAAPNAKSDDSVARWADLS